MRDIFTNAAYVYRIVICPLGNGCGVTTVPAFIEYFDAG
jgi:hypothetical protein